MVLYILGKSKIALALSVVTLVACGGSSNNETKPVTEPSTGITPIEAPTWVAGTFEPQNKYKNYCENPRTGNDPYNNSEPYPDKAGSELHEKMWLRSYSDHTYLWYSEIEDNDPNNFNVADYFSQLKTKQTTDSGAQKDNFHFSQNTADYKKQTQSGVTSGYGISWQFDSVVPPRKLIVRYTEPNSPAALLDVKRGTQIIEIDGADFVNGNNVNAINAGIFPSEVGESHDFKLLEPDGTMVTKTFVSADVISSPVQNTKVIETQVGKVGYLQFNSHIVLAQEGLINAIALFSDENISEMVVDLRYNGGGFLALASQFAYMVAGDHATNGATFEKTIFNDKHQSTNPITGNTLSPTPFFDKKIDYTTYQFTSEDLPSINLQRIFVLTTGSTCSASEAFINGLRGIDIDVIQIGNTTCGKPYGFYPQDNCGETYFTIQFKGVNAKGFGEYSDGFVPKESPQYLSEIKGCNVADDYSKALGDPSEGMFSAALDYMISESCPVVALSRAAKGDNKLQSGAQNDGLAIKVPNQILNSIILENKINSHLPIK
ncbi:peptidase [Pseudoalteromonas sp. NBT06-2]|uniref:S41 family peptidase n=1 Tax=Pseudoalteromonas sp. NBT06-2 TaxID=2025950 RepID=UPI000BA6F6B6|nr:S41 family peptidase [Pseudoalteromonas sp. NBT06-2]PAJ73901.1 peptidase [Pseudoalteromonas sp. NBT06-2]